MRTASRWGFGCLVAVAACAGAQTRPASAPAETRAPAPSGDFQAGDRIVLSVGGEKELSSTFTVRTGPLIELPALGSISLVGVRREDLQPYLAREIGRFVKNPVVQARSLVRVGVLGDVARPGFYDVPDDAILADAFTAAGGLLASAGIKKMRIERGGETLAAGDSVRKALDGGLTITQLRLQSGDELFVPSRSDADRTFRIVSLLLTIPAAIYAVSLVFR